MRPFLCVYLAFCLQGTKHWFYLRAYRSILQHFLIPPLHLYPPQSPSSLFSPSKAPTMSFPSLPQRRPSHIAPLSEPSENVFNLLADPNISFAAICRYIDSDVSPIINEAQILESRVYVECGALIAPHRKIVLKIRERRGDCFWLLLERMPSSKMALIKGLGATTASDRVSSKLTSCRAFPQLIFFLQHRESLAVTENCLPSS